MTTVTNGFVISESITSISRTWRGCSLCYPFNQHPFIDQWSGNCQKSSWEFPLDRSLVMLAILAGHDRNVVGLLSGSLKIEYLIGETPY